MVVTRHFEGSAVVFWAVEAGVVGAKLAEVEGAMR
tara:strand:+ start:2596 stop:2700 length:105 start_codon:yes stop_codon:yes gene_type:complete